MARIREVEPGHGNAAQERLFASDRELFGRVLGASRVYAHQPDVFARVQDLHRTLVAASTLPASVVAAARLRVAELRQSPF